MSQENKLEQFIKENNIDAEFIVFNSLVDNYENDLIALKNLDITFDDVIKTIIFVNQDAPLELGKGVIAIVPANMNVDKVKLKTICNKRIKISGPEEVLKLTDYVAGGVPPIGFAGDIYIDESLTNSSNKYPENTSM